MDLVKAVGISFCLGFAWIPPVSAQFPDLLKGMKEAAEKAVQDAVMDTSPPAQPPKPAGPNESNQKGAPLEGLRAPQQINSRERSGGNAFSISAFRSVWLGCPRFR